MKARSVEESSFAILEERLLLAAQPIVTVSGELSPLLGDQTELTVTFDNQPNGAPGGDVGYAPYLDLILPQNGADGSGTGSAAPAQNDGVTFAGATYLGSPLAAQVLEFDAAGQAIHPFARDATGALRVVNAADYGAAPGDQLVVLQLPFGSFVPDQPSASINVALNVSPLADAGTPLPVTAIGGFAFGRDALNNPTSDAPVLGTPSSVSLTPTVLSLNKTFNGPEGETTTGPNFPRSYTITLDLAEGQTITNASILDRLPDGLVLIGPPILAGAPGSAAFDATTNTVSATLDGTIVGVAGPEATLTLNFYVAETLAPGSPSTPVLDPVTGAPRTIGNDVSAAAGWTPLDPRDTARRIVIDEPGPEAVFTAKSLATQKSVSILLDANAPGLGPSDTLLYAIDIQISDYAAFRDLAVEDLLSDGQSFVPGSATLTVTENGSPLGSGAFGPGTLVFARDPVTGTTGLRFLVGDALVANGAPDGVLQGGAAALGATTLRLTYQATVDRFYVADGDAVGQGDRLTNAARVTGTLLDANGQPTGFAPEDSTTAGGQVETGRTAKSIYAVNGTAAAGGPVQVAAGDLVTFRLTYTMPQTLTETLELRDFLPLPIFDVDDGPLTLLDVVSADAPGVNQVKWGPLAGGFDALLTVPPELRVDSASNSLSIVFRDLRPDTPVPTTVDILFTLRVADRPFGDGLILTNQLLATETSQTGTSTSSQAIVQLTLTEPELRLTKGIIATDSTQGDFTLAAVAPVGVTPPGSGGFRFAAPIDSTGLGAVPVDSDLGDIDAGDRVTFAIIVENLGSGRNGAYDVLIRDTLQPGYRVPASGLNLQVTDGSGTALPFLLSGDIFTGGLTLIDPAGGRGALAPFAATGGANLLVITYDLEVTDAAAPRERITNTAEIGRYAALEGGVDRVPTTQEPTTDTATTAIGNPAIDKTIVATSLPQTGIASGDATLPDLSIGETVTFLLTATLREGRIEGFEILDRLPLAPGRLDFVSAEVVSLGGNLRLLNLDGTPGAALSAPVVTVNGNIVRFDFADAIVNLPDNLIDANDRIVLRVTAIAADVPANIPGADLPNVGALRFTAAGTPVEITDTATAEIVGPAFSLAKLADRDFAQGGEIVTYTVTLSPAAGVAPGPAFDLLLVDPLLPGTLSLVAGSAALLAAPAGAAIQEVGGAVRVTLPAILPGESLRFTYQARVEPTVGAGTTLPNTVSATADSFPGVNPLGVERALTLEATETVRVPGATIAKTVVAADTSLPETASAAFDPTRPDLAIGEVVTYRITVTLPEAVTSSVVVSDLLPAGPGGVFEYLGAGLLTVGGSLSGLPGTVTPVAADRNGDGIADSVSFALGNITNRPDGALDADDQVTFFVTARVRDAAANLAGLAAVNEARVSFIVDGASISSSATALVDLVEPNVALDKAASAAAGDAGDRVSYTLTLAAPSPDAGPAYDLRLSDTVPPGMDIDPATLRFTGAAPAGATLAYDAATRTISATIPLLLATDPAVVIAYDVVVAGSVRPAEVLTNTAALTFDSHPGAPGDAYQRDYGPVRDSTSFTVALPTIAKAVTASSLAQTGVSQFGPTITDLAIGETVTYTITVTLPEGTTPVQVFDLLPIPGANATTTGSIAWVSSEITAIGGNLSGALLGVGAQGTVTDRNGDGVADRVQWNLGTIVNAADNATTAADRIVFTVVGRVVDRPENVAGDRLTNTATIDYNGPAAGGQRSSTVGIDIVEPSLGPPTKVASIATGDAGDLVTYSVTIPRAATSSAPAFDLLIEDVLPAGVILEPGTVTLNLAAGRFVVESGGAAGDTAVRVRVAEYLLGDPPALTLTYQARLSDALRDGQAVTNTVAIGFDSAPGATPGQRIYAPQSASATVTADFAVTLDKTIIATSDATTGNGFFDPLLPDTGIGETVTYRLVATLGEGTQRLLVQDLLPAGLEALSARVVSVGGSITGAALAAGGGGVIGADGSVSFDFGAAVVNRGDNSLDGGDTIVMEVVARVRDIATNVAGTRLANDAAAVSDTGTGITRATPQVVEVVEPRLIVDKSVPAGFAAPGETLTYTVTLSHAAGSSASAYDIVLDDLIADPFLDLVPGTVTLSTGTILLGNGAGDGTVRISVPTLALGDTVSLAFTVRVAPDAPAGGSVANTAVVTYDSLGGPGGRPGTTTDGTVTPLLPGFVKEIVATSNTDTGAGAFDPSLPDLAVGETVTYRLTITLPQGRTDDLVLSDLLPSALVPLAARVVSVGSGLTTGAPAIAIAGQSVTLAFGTAVNGSGAAIGAEDRIAVEIDARVADLAGLVAGAILRNDASADFTIGGRAGNLDVAVSAELVEPNLAITKRVDATTGDAGDVFTYTVTIAHAAGSTAAAYDVRITDILDPRLVPIDVVASLGTASIAGDTVTLDVPRLLVTDAPVTLTYRVRFSDAIEPGERVANTAALGWDSNPGAGGRPGTTQASAADLLAVFDLGLTKSIVATSLPTTGADRFDPTRTDLAVGELVTYELVATLSEGTQRLVLTDTLPTGLGFEPGLARVVSTGGAISAGAGGTLSPTAIVSGQTVTFDFGTLVNAGNNLADAADRVVVQVVARVLDEPVNTNGRVVENLGTARIAAPTLPGVPGGTLEAAAFALADIVIPSLALDKAVDRAGGDAGDVFTFTVTIAPRSDDEGPAYDVLVLDTLPTLLLLDPASITTSLGTASATGNTIRVEIPVLLPDAPPVVITYRAAFADGIEPGQVVPNRATLDYASAPGQGRVFADDAVASVRGDFTLDLSKAVVASSLPETGSAYFDPALPDIAAGETVTFRLTATLAEGTQRLVIADTLPAGLVAEQARLVSVAPGIAAAAPTITLDAGRVVFDFGTVVNRGDNAGTDTVVVEVVARLSAAPAPGGALLNAATAEATAPTNPALPGGSLSAVAGAAIDPVAAVLVFDKQEDRTTLGLGEVITYTLTLTHAASSTAPAYDVVLLDPLSDASLQLVAGSVVASGGAVVTGNGAGDGTVRVTMPVLLPGQVLTVTFQARAVGIPVPDGIATNTAGFTSISAPGDLPAGFARLASGQDSERVQIASGTPGAQGGLLAEFDEAFRRIARNAIDAPAVLSGTAQPGASVALALRDASGAPVTLVGLTADVGGHWVANPIATATPGTPDTQALDAATELAGRERASAALPPSLPAPAALTPTTAPYTVFAAETPAAFEGRAGTDGMRVTFGGALQPGGAFVGAPETPGLVAAAPTAAAVQRDQAGFAAPTSLAWNRFAVDFAAAAAVAGVAAR